MGSSGSGVGDVVKREATAVAQYRQVLEQASPNELVMLLLTKQLMPRTTRMQVSHRKRS